MPGPYGRAPGSLTATTRSRVATASAALISQRSGPLTASPAGEAGRVYGKAAAHRCGPGMPGPYSVAKNFPNPLDTPLFL